MGTLEKFEKFQLKSHTQSLIIGGNGAAFAAISDIGGDDGGVVIFDAGEGSMMVEGYGREVRYVDTDGDGEWDIKHIRTFHSDGSLKKHVIKYR
jgi:hypothetical protein